MLKTVVTDNLEAVAPCCLLVRYSAVGVVGYETSALLSAVSEVEDSPPAAVSGHCQKTVGACLRGSKITVF